MANLSTSNLGSLNSTAVAKPLDNFGTAAVLISGTWSGTITFEGSADGTTYSTIFAYSLSSNLLVNTTTSNGQYLISTAGLTSIRAKMSSYSSGSADVLIQATAAVNLMTSAAFLLGATDATQIGNVGDRLKVDANFNAPPTVKPGLTGSKLRILDMNASNGGVARDTGISSTTVYTTLFNYSGSGNVFAFLVTFEGNLIGADTFTIKFEVDSVIVFEVSTDDVGTAALYNLTTDGDENTMGLSLVSNVLRFAAPHGVGVSYSSNVKVSIKKTSSTASKRFRAGMIYMTKDT